MAEEGHTRGQFLGAGAALSAGALASTWRSPEAAEAQEAAPTPLAASEGVVTEGAFGPDFDGEKFFLELDGEPGGFVVDVQGGFPHGEILETPNGPDQFKKHIGNVKYEEVSFKFAMTQQPQGLFNWISETLDRSVPSRSGSIKACDADFRVTQQGHFTDALITEIGFPALDAAAKDPAYMTLKFSSDAIATEGGGGTVPSGGVKAGDASFKFAAGSLSSKAPAKIDAFTIKQGLAEVSPGGPKRAAKISIPDIKVTLTRNSGLSSWLAFYEDFLVEGNHSEADEIDGQVTLTNSKGTKELATIDLLNMGILAAIPVTEQVDGETVRRVQVEMYCEELHFDIASS
ncbi:MAG: hypothetical protein QOI31_246 [Solirubrobacterales bacterium]|nr:hypothetical protein [Solirubrobacterales bacterium]